MASLYAKSHRHLLASEADERGADARDRRDVVHERHRVIGHVDDDAQVRDRVWLQVRGGRRRRGPREVRREITQGCRRWF